MDDATLQFAREHIHADTVQLLLQSARYPHIDIRAAVQQIEGLRTATDKWPSLLEVAAFRYPPRLNREQSSSEATARYKAEQLCGHGWRVADLTGGMGIDSWLLAQKGGSVDYVEQDTDLCQLAQENFAALGIQNIRCHCGDSMEWIARQGYYDLIFIDPARRGKHGQRVYAVEDCLPDILQHLNLLRSHCHTLLVKASPMIDLQLACQQLGCVQEVVVLAVKGECKEVVFLCGEPQGEPLIKCENITGQTTTTSPFTFTWQEERQAEAHYCVEVGAFLYEPHAALMKGGAYKLLAQRYGVAQLDPNSHLYTSTDGRSDFPGRIFHVVQPVKLNRTELRALIPEGCIHVVTRNYPVAAADLQRKLGLREGGNRYLIATTVAGHRCTFLCERIDK